MAEVTAPLTAVSINRRRGIAFLRLFVIRHPCIVDRRLNRDLVKSSIGMWSSAVGSIHALRFIVGSLSIQHELGRQEAVLLRHGCLGPVQDAGTSCSPYGSGWFEQSM